MKKAIYNQIRPNINRVSVHHLMASRCWYVSGQVTSGVLGGKREQQ